MQRNIQTAETAAGRYTRGMFAATAASTGFFRAVSFASGAFLVGALAGGAIASAVQEFRDATVIGAQVAAVLEATGESANVTAGQIDALAQRQLKLTGVDDELVKSASAVLLTFRSIRDEVGAGNKIFTRAVKDVQDISSVFGTALTGSAVQLGKALQDPIRGVTALRRSGITLSQSQRDLIKQLVETGRILSAQKIILGEVERQVGGTAEAIGKTLPGQLNILRESAKNALGEYVKRVSESRQATEIAVGVSKGLGDAFSALRSVVATLGPPLLATAQALGRITEAIGGVGTLLAAAAAYKSITVAVSLAATAQRLYARAALIGTGATVAETRAIGASTTAFRLQTAASSVSTLGTTAARASVGLRALRIGSAALGGPVGIAALAVTGLTIGLIKLRQAAQNAPGALNATQRALDDLSDSVARANKLQSQLAGRREDISIANFNVQAAQRDVTRAQGRADTSRAAPGSIEQLALADRVIEAQTRLEQANKELVAAERQRDIAEGQFAANQRSRQFVIANTTRNVLAQVAALGKQQRIVTAFGVPVGIRLFQKELSDTTKLRNFTELMDRLAKSGKPVERQVGGALEAVRIVLDSLPTQKQIELAVKLTGQGQSLNQVVAQILALDGAARKLFVLPGPQEGLLSPGNLDLLHRKIARLGDEIATVKSLSIGTDRGETLIPSVINGQIVSTQKAIEHFNKTGENLGTFQNVAAANRYAEALHRQQAAYYGAARGAATLADTEQIRSRGLVTVSPSAQREQEFLGAKAVLNTERERLKVLRETATKRTEELQTQRASLSAAKEAVTAAREGLSAAIEGLAAARQALTDTIRSSREAVNQAVSDAKSNLASLGQAVADALAKFQDAGGRTLRGGKLGAEFRRLRDQIIGGQGGPETQRAAQEVAFRLQAQAPEVDTSKVAQGFADLTDNLNRGRITLPQFNKQLAALLKGLDFNAFRKQFGSAATNLLREEIAALRKQARLVLGGPQRPGGGAQQVLIRPMQAVAAGARDIAAAQKDVVRARADVVKADHDLEGAIRDLHRAQVRETRANTLATRANSRVVQQLVDVMRAQQKLEGPKKKPKGDAAKTSGDLTNAGAGSP